MEDLKHLGHPFVPFVCRHLRDKNNFRYFKNRGDDKKNKKKKTYLSLHLAYCAYNFYFS